MSERQEVLRRTMTEWVNARQWVPDSPRMVIALVGNKAGLLRPVECRFSGGAWRFLTPRDRTRNKRNVVVWMDIPWWDRHEQERAGKADSSPKPAGTKARPECEAESQVKGGPHGRDARKEAGLSQAEADFDGLTP